MNRLAIRPFLKWAGGKRQLLPAVAPVLSGRARRLLRAVPRQRRGVLRSRRPRRSHDAPDHAERRQRRSHRLLPPRAGPAGRRDPRARATGRRPRGRGRATSIATCAMRASTPCAPGWRRDGGTADAYPAELAAMLIYLNRTGYNGLFRLNADGGYNVPPGRYDRPRIVDRAAARIRLADPAGAAPAHRARGVRIGCSIARAPATSSISIRRTRR